jgi:ribosomal protein S18 acetylase RimI-like enzyme
MTFIIETANRDHLTQMVDILNDIIEVGQFTAHRRRFDGQRMLDYYLEPTGLISCAVAVDGGHVLGFQSLEWDRKDTDQTVGSIATFARLNTHRTGAARALFAETCARARAAGVKKIDATIRADNVKGLGFYRSMGFKDVFIYRDVPMSDGVKVDRIQTIYDLTR